jgi:hypothetical protein
MRSTHNTMTVLSVMLVIAGFLVPLWELQVIGILLAGLSGRLIVAIGLGLLVDIAYGTPTGIFHFLYFPFTLLALLSYGLSRLGKSFLLDKSFSGKI